MALTTLVFAALGVAQAPAAQAAEKVTLAPAYRPDSRLLYSVTIHSDLGGRAQMNTAAEISMHILPGAAPGRFEAELRFLKYHTTVSATDAASRAGVQQQATANDQAAQSMPPARFRVDDGGIEVLSRPQGAQYDQAVDMLEELARTDSLPTGPVKVGEHWTRQSSRELPGMHTAVALTLDCQLTALGGNATAPTATVETHSQGSTQLPPNALPGSQELAEQGLVPEATVTFDTTATSVYQLPSAILQQTSSETRNHMRLRLVGPSPEAQTSDTEIHSTAVVKLERVED